MFRIGRIPEARHDALKTPNCIGAEWLLMAPQQVSVRSFLETSLFGAMWCIHYRGGGLGLAWPEKCGAATNWQPSLGKVIYFDMAIGTTIMTG